MTYPEAIRYLESFINYEKIPAYPYKESLKLNRVRDFLETINNPQDALKCVHVAGSKGKGSTCAFITYILREAGYKVGLYTSPHLSDFRERIRILEHKSSRAQELKSTTDFEGMISKRRLAGLVERLKPGIEGYNKSSRYGSLSFFEVYTSLAFVYFREEKVDFAVLETGLGGRLDATNVVNPFICAITPISLEHTQKLGNTLGQIAREKAGIIKSRKSQVPSSKLIVVSAPQKKEAADVIRNRCSKVEAKLYEVGKDIEYQRRGGVFSVKGVLREFRGLKTKLSGAHQLINATVALGVIEALGTQNTNAGSGICVGTDAVKRGLYNTIWPGRCEIISRSPLVVLDGAQNSASARALKDTVKENWKYKKLILILGVSQDKDIRGICNELRDLADKVILTRADNPRAAPVQALAGYFEGKTLYKTRNIKQARDIARRNAGKEDLVLVTGSLFVVGEFRNERF